MDRFLKRTEHPVSPVLPVLRSKKFLPNKVSSLLYLGHLSLDYIFMKVEANSFAKVAIWLLTNIGSL